MSGAPATCGSTSTCGPRPRIFPEWARFSQTAGQAGEARRHYERARALVEELGYGRRDAEVRELGAVVGEGVGL